MQGMAKQTADGRIEFPQFNRLILTAVFALLLASTQIAQAATIDLGVSWPTFSGINSGNYATSPYNLVRGVEGGTHSTETAVANFVNGAIGTSYVASDINKFGAPTELGGDDGYFLVPAGWTYLVVQYDGPNGGSVLVNLGGNDASVPYDSSAIWGTADKYAISHYSLIAPTTPPTPTSVPVPDGGATVLMLGSALMGIAAFRRTFLKA